MRIQYYTQARFHSLEVTMSGGPPPDMIHHCLYMFSLAKCLNPTIPGMQIQEDVEPKYILLLKDADNDEFDFSMLFVSHSCFLFMHITIVAMI